MKIIDQRDIKKKLTTKWAGQTVLVHEKLDSTNDEVGRIARQDAEHGTLVLAETQDKGKGRRGRSWVTPAGSAVAMSLLLRPDITPANASMITLVMGLAVASACKKLYQLDVQIKWPNDVVVNGRKICGILTEMSSEIDHIHHVVIGTGINTCVQEFPQELIQTAVSIHELIGREPDRAELIACCMEQFETYYEVFIKTEDLSLLMEDYNSYLAGRNSRVRVLEPGNEYTGIAEGINARGELQVRKEDGTVTSVYAGEVSVRGIYGYI